MDRALVVVDDTEAHRTLLREAGELAAGVDAELVLLAFLTEEEADKDMETMASIATVEDISVDAESITESAANAANEVAADVFGDISVSYDAVGRIVDADEFADGVLETAAEHDCDHVFITGRRRSPTGKAIFGDTAQAVALNFEGPVTILTT